MPLLHGATASAGENEESCDAEGGYRDFGELLPRSVGFRAACLTFEAERTAGAPAVDAACRYFTAFEVHE